jgi:hypothetical protein
LIASRFSAGDMSRLHSIERTAFLIFARRFDAASAPFALRARRLALGVGLGLVLLARAPCSSFTVFTAVRYFSSAS